MDTECNICLETISNHHCTGSINLTTEKNNSKFATWNMLGWNKKNEREREWGGESEWMSECVCVWLWVKFVRCKMKACGTYWEWDRERRVLVYHRQHPVCVRRRLLTLRPSLHLLNHKASKSLTLIIMCQFTVTKRYSFQLNKNCSVSLLFQTTKFICISLVLSVFYGKKWFLKKWLILFEIRFLKNDL